QAGQDGDEGGLARAVRPEQPEELAFLDVEGDAVQSLEGAPRSAVGLGDGLEGDRGHGEPAILTRGSCPRPRRVRPLREAGVRRRTGWRAPAAGDATGARRSACPRPAPRGGIPAAPRAPTNRSDAAPTHRPRP